MAEPRGRPVKLTKSSLERALRANGGIQTKAAASLGVPRMTVHRALIRWPELRDVIIEAREELLDDAEDGLRELVAARNVASIIFTLKTIGKSRGYSERHEVTGPGGGPLAVDVTKLSDDDLRKLIGDGPAPAGGGGSGEAA